ncbi:MAG: hypothetical protein QOD75_1639 [Blastocatellia bacterium]|jgi:hypothetical protein|nr:hypothetical protein [Blastocatellia bacterium]
MGGEGRILNLLCVLAALAFLALAVLNFLSEGNFLSTDSLFITLVWVMLAMLFLSVPALDMFSRGVIRVPFMKGKGKPAVVSAGNAPVTTDAKGRPMPPDVRRMVSDMKSRKQP